MNTTNRKLKKKKKKRKGFIHYKTDLYITYIKGSHIDERANEKKASDFRITSPFTVDPSIKSQPGYQHEQIE